MKLFIAIFLIILFFFPIVLGITGQVPSEKINLTINVKDFFYFKLISPENGTYITKNIDLNYSQKNLDEILININEEENKSIEQIKKLNFPEKENTLNIYLTKNNQTIKKTYKIKIDENKYKIIYNKYNKYNQTTKIEQKPIQKFNSIYDLSLKNDLGKIIFLEPINLKQELEENNNTLDLDKNSKIEHKRIYLDEKKLKQLNKKAQIEMYEINLKKPKIKKDGKDCKEDCEFISYKNRTFIFKVDSFSSYTLVESETNFPKDTMNSASINQIEFELNETSINTNLSPSQEKEIKIKIKNNLNKAITINTNNSKIFLSSIEKEIKLSSHEQKEIKIKIKIPSNQTIKTYLEKITFESKKTSKELPILINLKSSSSSINIKVDILNDKKIKPKEKLIIYSQIINLEQNKEKNLSIKCEIKNDQEKTLFTKKETILVQNIRENIGHFQLPSHIQPGLYYVALTVQDQEKMITSSDSFVINKENKILLPLLLAISIIIVGTIIYKIKESKSLTK